MGEQIQLTAADGHQLSAYKADPAGTPKGGIVVIQEIFGVNAHIRNLVDQYAVQGYAAIAPAFYDRAERDADLGYADEDRKKGMELRSQIEREMAVNDMTAGADALNLNGKVGVVGFCWGGQLAWIGADCGRFQAAVTYYGGGIDALLDLDPKCPVMMHFGEADQGITMDKVEAIKAGGTGAQIFTYP
ncbi:MAG: dienelactone hydrolase family protein, partial [Rhodospirillales bacterium]|nr:dienelactone hydrolase family protein [Rhodospirillales bacterium]